MSFLYIGLGLAMISGISAMMQIGNNINNLQTLSSFKQNKYYQSSLPSYDRRIMNFLNDYSGLESEVCLKIKEKKVDNLRVIINTLIVLQEWPMADILLIIDQILI